MFNSGSRQPKNYGSGWLTADPSQKHPRSTEFYYLNAENICKEEKIEMDVSELLQYVELFIVFICAMLLSYLISFFIKKIMHRKK